MFIPPPLIPLIASRCLLAALLVLIPFADFEPWLDESWTTTSGDRPYWHVTIIRDREKYSLRRRKGSKVVDLTKYVLPASAQ